MPTQKCPLCQKMKDIEDFRRLTGLKNKFNKHCQDCIAPVKARYELKKASISAYQKLYREAHKDYTKVYNAKWRLENAELVRKDKNVSYDTDPHFKWKTVTRQNLRGLIAKAFEFEITLGCSFVVFKSYIEDKFQPNMSWDNYGRGEGKWSFDHIKSLDKMTPEENPNHYTNLQPLWNKQNASKGNR